MGKKKIPTQLCGENLKKRDNIKYLALDDGIIRW
jgi:hypothetical protein